MTNIPYGNPGMAAGVDTEVFRQDDLLLSNTPVLFTQDLTLAASQDIDLYEVVGFNEDKQVVPATHQGHGAIVATGVLTFSDVAIADETVTIDGVVYTFKAAPAAAYEVDIGVDAAACATNLILAINAGPVTDGAEEYYETGTDEHPSVIASEGSAAGAVEIRAKVAGESGEVASTETLTNGAFGSATLTGGAGGVQAIGVAAGAITSGVGENPTIQVYRGGHFNADALVWGASFDDDSKKLAAFDGAPTPTGIVVGVNKYNRKPAA